MIEQINKIAKLKVATQEYVNYISKKVILDKSVFTDTNNTELYNSIQDLSKLIVDNEFKRKIENFAKENPNINYLAVKPNSLLSVVTYSTISDMPNDKYPSISMTLANKLADKIKDDLLNLKNVIIPEMNTIKYKMESLIRETSNDKDVDELFSIVNVDYEALKDVLVNTGYLKQNGTNFNIETLAKVSIPSDLSTIDVRETLASIKDPEIEDVINLTLENIGNVDHVLEETSDLLYGTSMADILANVNKLVTGEIIVALLLYVILDNYKRNSKPGLLVEGSIDVILNKLYKLINMFDTNIKTFKKRDAVVINVEKENDEFIIYTILDNYNKLQEKDKTVTLTTIYGGVIKKLAENGKLNKGGKYFVLLTIDDIIINKTNYNSYYKKYMDMLMLENVENNADRYKEAIVLAFRSASTVLLDILNIHLLSELQKRVHNYIKKKTITELGNSDIVIEIFENELLKGTSLRNYLINTREAVNVVGDENPDIIMAYAVLKYITEIILAGLEPVENI